MLFPSVKKKCPPEGSRIAENARAGVFAYLCFLFFRKLGQNHRGENQAAAEYFRTGHGFVQQQPAEEGGEDGFQAHEQRGRRGGDPLLADDL